jgi:hypothetical protein
LSHTCDKQENCDEAWNLFLRDELHLQLCWVEDDGQTSCQLNGR